MDSKLFTLHTIETLWNKIKNKFYVKSADGIPKNDLDIAVQSSLDKADSALQEHQDISGKQDKSTAVTHSANTAVGSATKPVYVAENGVTMAISHSINADVPANAKFTDTTYSDATESTHGLMSAADKKKLDEMDLTKYLPKDGTAKKAELLSSGQMRSAYCHNDDATFSNGHVWFKIGTATLSGGNSTITTTFLGICGYGKHALYTARIRLTSAGNAVHSITFLESGRTGGMLTGLFRIVAINSEKNVTFELWAKGASRWEGTKIVILNEMQLDGISQGNFWTLTSRGNADAKQNPTSGNMYVDSSDSSVCATAAKANEATTLTDSGWVNMTLESYSESGTVKYRIYGKQITITGEVVLKNNVATSYYAPQAIASTTLDFSKIVGCSGVGRSSSGKGVYVNAENFNGDNIVCVYALGGEIAAGKTLYFTITGFID